MELLVIINLEICNYLSMLYCFVRKRKKLLFGRLSSNVSMMTAFDSEIRNPYFDINIYETGWLVCFCKRDGERGVMNY